MKNSENLSNSFIFPKGKKITEDTFTGNAWAETLVSADSPFNCPIYNVTIAPGARNNWHKHPGGQILLVTAGKGYYQEEGKPARSIKTGDVVMVPPDVKHWHGAAPDSWLVHLSITANPQKGNLEWLQPVTDAEYNNLKKFEY